MPVSDDDSALHEGAVLGAIDERRQITVAGPDRATFLHGFLTNDIAALRPGTGCYAAWLTPQGRMLTDMHVLESGDTVLLDVPAAEVESAAQRLEQFHFTEDVQVRNLAEALRSVWLHGPGASKVLSTLTSSNVTSGADSYAAWVNYQNARVELGGISTVIARIDQLGVPGYVVYVDGVQEVALRQAFVTAGARPVAREVIEAARVEACYPVFGVDMTSETIPLEAGIEDRAISLTKGCYVGQEVIIRVLHRGHGRVARKLVGLRVSGQVPTSGAKVFSGEREIGFVTSAATSPRVGSVALAYLHRDFVQPGTVVDVEVAPGRAAATVRSRSTS